MTSNDEVARLLHELAVLTELDEQNRQSFRARAYHTAVRAVTAERRDVGRLSRQELAGIKGIGASIAAKIVEHAATGRIAKLEELRRRFPPGYRELARLPGIGPKTLELLREHLDVRSIDDLTVAIAKQHVREVPGLGVKTEQNLARDIDRLGLFGKERRTPIADALPVAERIVATLREVDEVQRVAYAGSLRRFRDTIADIDVVVASTDPAPVAAAFVAMPMVREVLATGHKKSSVRVQGHIQVDLRVVAPEQWGAAQLYFTGSKAHNIRIRERAVRRGLTLNEYGLFELDDDHPGRLVAAATEKDIYEALDLAWVPPGLREDIGEVEAAAEDSLPRLADVGDLRGDLHVHSAASGDGHESIETLVRAAGDRGYEYLAITDHAEGLAVNGVSRDGMLAQREHIRRLAGEHRGVNLLHGVELNIGPDGELDYDREFLAGFDWCVASVHSHFNLDRARQTNRLVTAMRHPAVNVIGHLQGRRIGRRPGLTIDVDAVLDAAEETECAIEINSHLDRLDAAVDVLRAARDRNVVFVINSDAHRLAELDNVRFGVRHAERGWVAADRIANTWEVERFRGWTAAMPREG